MVTFVDMLNYFLNPWGKLLFGFFAFGFAFLLGRGISISLLIATLLFIALGFMYGLDTVFFLIAGLCLILAIFAKASGL